MLTIKSEPVYSYIQDPVAVQMLIHDLDRRLRLKVPGAYFAKSFGKGWDGYAHFVTPRGRFLSGLEPLVRKELLDMGQEVCTVRPNRPRGTQKGTKIELNGVTLHPYQAQAVSTALGAYRGIFKMATNAGKTEVAIALMANLAKLGPVLWLTHSLTLSEQTANRILARIGLSVSVCRRGALDLSGQVVVSTVQTLNGAIKKDTKGRLTTWLASVPAIILDECHLGSADMWVNVVTRCTSAHYRIGMSGTPFTDDKIRNRKLIGLTGEVLSEVSNQFLIESEVSTRPTVVGVPFTHREYLSYIMAIDVGVDHNFQRNAKILRTLRKLEHGRPGMVLVQHISQGKELLAMAQEMGLRAAFVRGANDLSERGSAVHALLGNELDMLIATTIFDIGVDIPELRWIFLASPTKSTVRILQRIGRVLRKSEGKSEAMIYYVDDDGDYFLKSAAKKIRTVVAKEGFDVL